MRIIWLGFQSTVSETTEVTSVGRIEELPGHSWSNSASSEEISLSSFNKEHAEVTAQWQIAVLISQQSS